MSTALAKPTIHSVLKEDSVKNRINEVLGKRAPQFCSSLVSLTQANQRLREADPNSVLASAMTAALLDLPINANLGFAYIVPYSGVAQFQMGYKGFIQLAMRSGQYRNLNACVIYDGELVAYNKLRGELELDETRKVSDAPIGYAAYMELVNGFRHGIYWTVDQIRSHSERYSQAVKSKKKDSPWFTNFDSMALKTVIKMLLSKWGPLSIELQQAIIVDQAAFTSIGGDPQFIDNSPDGLPLIPAPQGEPPVGRDSIRNGSTSPPKSEDSEPCTDETRNLVNDELIRTGNTGAAAEALAKKAGADRWSKITEKQALAMLAELKDCVDAAPAAGKRRTYADV